MSQNRRVYISFKDALLGDILQYCLKSLGTLLNKLAELSNEQQGVFMTIILQCLKVANSCVCFDFAAKFDETLENPSYNQMPLAWSAIIINETLLQPIFDIAFKFRSEEHQIQALQFIGELCNCRVTFFKDLVERQNYYRWLVPKMLFAIRHVSNSAATYKECLVAFSKYMVNNALFYYS